MDGQWFRPNDQREDASHFIILKNFSKANGVHEINEKIGKLLADAEKMGMEGEVEKSQEVIEMMFMARIIYFIQDYERSWSSKRWKKKCRTKLSEFDAQESFSKTSLWRENIILMQKMSLWLSFENYRQFSSSTTASPSVWSLLVIFGEFRWSPWQWQKTSRSLWRQTSSWFYRS